MPLRSLLQSFEMLCRICSRQSHWEGVGADVAVQGSEAFRHWGEALGGNRGLGSNHKLHTH